MGRTMLLAALLVTTVALVAIGAVPQAINYQGVLTDGSGTPVTDGSYSITFNLYHQESGGSPIWTQTSPVSVTGGIFNVYLGPIPLEFFEHFEYLVYLGLSIEGGPELTPRRPLVASPYALVAATVMDDAIHAFKIADGNVVRSLNGLTDDVNLLAGSNVTITPSGQDITISATGGGGGVGGTGTAGQVAFWSDPTTLTGVNELFWDDTNKRLGIGTPGPNARLRVESSEQYTAVIAGDYLSDATQILRVNFTGTGSYHNPTAIFGRSRPADGYGYGGSFEGGRGGVYGWGNQGANADSDSPYGVKGKASGSSACPARYGLYGEADGPNSVATFGVYAVASGTPSDYAAGVWGTAETADTRYGVVGISYYLGSSSTAGVYGGAPIDPTSTAVFANGDLQYTGSLIGPVSDKNAKQNAAPIEGMLARLKQVEPQSFEYKLDDPEYKDLHLSPGRHFGIMAQDLESVFPELVATKIYSRAHSKDNPGQPPLELKSVNYMEMIPVLLQAIKEQQTIIEKQQDNIDDLKTRVAELEK